eukprot:GDKI01010606.1.p1 GENE.GDKI01010606.1~~GDKI01010606.1.p1  ORF type:complete len:114 (+),score=36.79 GDKI01010606.1:502-843(+)
MYRGGVNKRMQWVHTNTCTKGFSHTTYTHTDTKRKTKHDTDQGAQHTHAQITHSRSHDKSKPTHRWNKSNRFQMIFCTSTVTAEHTRAHTIHTRTHNMHTHKQTVCNLPNTHK